MFATDEDAINRGAVARVSDWLRSGGDVDARDATGRTLLMLAGPAHNVCSLAFGCPGLAVSDGRRARELYLLATVEDDSPAAAQPLCIGGSVPGEAASTDTHALPDKDASEEAVSLAAEAGQLSSGMSQLSVEGAASADTHPATTEGLAAGPAYGSQVEVEVNANGVAKSADGGRYTPRLGKACDLCHQNRLKCTMLSTGCCGECTVRGIECKRRMEGRRGRPRATAENIVQLVQRRAAARKQQLPGGASGRVRNAAAREIGAVPQTGDAFPSFHDPAIQAAYAAGLQAGTQAIMMQYYGPAHPPFHMSPVSQCPHLMAPHGVQLFGAPAQHAPQHPAFGDTTQPMFNGAATAAMAGQYGVGGLDGTAANQQYANQQDGTAAYQQYANQQYASWYAAMYARFQQHQQ